LKGKGGAPRTESKRKERLVQEGDQPKPTPEKKSYRSLEDPELPGQPKGGGGGRERWGPIEREI